MVLSVQGHFNVSLNFCPNSLIFCGWLLLLSDEKICKYGIDK